MSSPLLDTILRLPIDERVVLAHDIWKSIEDETATYILSDAWREEIERRLADLKAHPEDSIPWSQVLAELQAES